VIKRARILFPHALNESRAFNIVNEKYVLTYGRINSAAAASVRRFSMGQDPTQFFRNDWIACSLVAIAA